MSQRFKVMVQEKSQFGDFAQLCVVDDRFQQMLGQVLAAKSGKDAQSPDFPDGFVFINRCPAQ